MPPKGKVTKNPPVREARKQPIQDTYESCSLLQALRRLITWARGHKEKGRAYTSKFLKR